MITSEEESFLLTNRQLQIYDQLLCTLVKTVHFWGVTNLFFPSIKIDQKRIFVVFPMKTEITTFDIR